ncbi:hypothetical protein Goarm_023124, partial [Gossypium armourianum]|nr:hypothetical protein [Gossypium armourianum]
MHRGCLEIFWWYLVSAALLKNSAYLIRAFALFRETLLGKQVDYSGCSVIVVGPSLSLHRCGLPREIAKELFQTFVIHCLIGQHFAPNIRVAKSKIWEKGLIVWVILQEVMRGHPVLLNRAPTLHRLALETQAEACLLMFSHMNLLSPAIRDPIFVPTQDMLIGLYVLTSGNRREPHSWRPVELEEAVGIIVGQSIGEPRTRKSSGIAKYGTLGVHSIVKREDVIEYQGVKK